MGYRLLGRLHAAVHTARERLSSEIGQGTVEYVALVLLIAGVFAAVIASGKGGGAAIAHKIISKLQRAISDIGT